MRCSNCGADNPEGARFCDECASPLPLPCPSCGASNRARAKFCHACASPLTGVAPTPAAAPRLPDRPAIHVGSASPDIHDPPDGERKTVTALFADIKGSMELMEDLDPEEARAIVDPALKLMIDAVRRYDGYIVQSTGDGIFALFGAPVAHEDHPQRALYAALRLQDATRSYSAKLVAEGGTPLEARVGINTGEVVVRTLTTGDGHAEYTPIGHTANLAARMQAVAPTGSIAITEHTRSLVEGYFQLRPRGPTRVKGLSEPIDVYEVIGLGPLRTRLERAMGRGLSKFVGRQAEMEALKRAMDLAKGGHGQIVAAMAEPGVGKSRLFYEFKAAAQSGTMVLEAFSVSHGKASAYLPVIDLLKNYVRIAPEDDERARREKVTGKVLALDRSLEDILPYLFVLLDIQQGDDPLAQLDPQLKRRRTLEAIKRLLVRESLGQPLIVIFEDLHWIDSETQALLNLFVDGVATARILLLVNYRPEYQHRWGGKTYYTQLRLDPLGKESADEMLTALVGDTGELAPLKRLIIERTEGNPFFMEEMVQALLEQRVLTHNGVVKLVRPLDEIRVPPTVQAILASRIDRLPPAEKELLQSLAVMGREFPFELIKRVTAKPDAELERMLSVLQLGEFIYEQPAMGDIEYTFKHALTQEVAYHSVLTDRRRILHERAGQALEELFAGRLEDHLTELASHYDRSGNLRKGVEYLGRAGAIAAHRSAHSEAIGYFTRALELLKRLPPDQDIARQELGLQMALGRCLLVARGTGVPERERVLVRARELCEQLGDNARLMEVLLAIAAFRLARREHGPARELAKSALALAERFKAPPALAGAHVELGVILLAAGQLEAAREHFEHALEFPGVRIAGQSGDIARSLLASVLLTLGYPEAALTRSRESTAAARELCDPFNVAAALLLEASIHLQRRDRRTALERAEELLSIAVEHELTWHLAIAPFLCDCATTGAARGEERIAEMRHTLSEARRASPLAFTRLLILFAEACGENGHPEKGLAAVAEGLARAEQLGERHSEADLHRVKGELLLLKDPSTQTEAERCFRIAIDIARAQGAKWFELRATTSLARLLKGHGNTAEALQMLAEIYNWFTEGLELADLKDAKALLDELNSKQGTR